MNEFPNRVNWSSYSVPEIAELLDQEYQDAWDQVMNWVAVYEAIDGHRRLLAKARLQLAESWPPQHSTAAVAYITVVDDLDHAMADTADSAFANGKARAGTLNALSAARFSIDQIHNEWQLARSQTPNRLMELNARAHQVMALADENIFDDYRQLRTPGLYQPPGGWENYKLIPNPGDTPEGSRGHASGNPVQEDQVSRTTPKTAFTSSPPDLPTSPFPSTSDSGRSIPSSDIHASDSLGLSPAELAIVIRDNSTRNTDLKINDVSRGGYVSSTAHDPTNQPSLQNSGARTGHTTSPVDSTGMLSPGAAMPVRPQSRYSRRRRPHLSASATTSLGVPALILPKEDGPIYHDPGPGVIGISR